MCLKVLQCFDETVVDFIAQYVGTLQATPIVIIRTAGVQGHLYPGFLKERRSCVYTHMGFNNCFVLRVSPTVNRLLMCRIGRACAFGDIRQRYEPNGWDIHLVCNGVFLLF
jgi:hypothetical protein